MSHPGFKAVQNQIAAKEGVSKDAAGAILANSSRNASSAAKRKNPRLDKVKSRSEAIKRRMRNGDSPGGY